MGPGISLQAIYPDYTSDRPLYLIVPRGITEEQRRDIEEYCNAQGIGLRYQENIPTRGQRHDFDAAMEEYIKAAELKREEEQLRSRNISAFDCRAQKPQHIERKGQRLWMARKNPHRV